MELDLAIQRFPLEAFLAARGAASGRKEWQLTCPRCGKDNLTVNIQRRQWRCFTCERYYPHLDANARRQPYTGAGGVFTLVEWLTGMPRSEVARQIIAAAEHAAPPPGILPGLDAAPASSHADARRTPTGLPDSAVDLDGTVPYMQRRGITLHTFKAFGMRYVPPGRGWVANRLVFPVWERGTCLYWQARACWDEAEHVPRWPGDKFRKSLNPLSERNGVRYFGSADVLGNLELAAQYKRVVLVEGPTSGIRVGLDAVWSFGKQLSAAQVARLVAAGVRAVDFMWDGPTPGKDGAGSAAARCPCHGNPGCAWQHMLLHAPMLAGHMDVRLVFLPRGDPGDYSPEQIAWFRAQARPWSGAAL